MNHVIRIAAYGANAILLIFLIYTAVFEIYDTPSRLLFLLAAAAPTLALLALRSGPDGEERTLARQLNKARMRAELSALEQK